MPTISLNNHTIRTMAFFKDKTGVSPINCIGVNNTIIFVVESGSAKKAVGQNGEKVKAISSALKKDIKIVERGKTIDETIEKFIYPIPFNSSKVVRGTLAILLKKEILLIIIGGVFVVEVMSVIIQILYFNITKKKYGKGKRIFKMAPLHHHFELSGWSENHVVVRFWIIGIILALVSLTTFKIQ